MRWLSRCHLPWRHWTFADRWRLGLVQHHAQKMRYYQLELPYSFHFLSVSEFRFRSVSCRESRTSDPTQSSPNAGYWHNQLVSSNSLDSRRIYSEGNDNRNTSSVTMAMRVADVASTVSQNAGSVLASLELGNQNDPWGAQTQSGSRQCAQRYMVVK